MTAREPMNRLTREGWTRRPGKGSHVIFKMNGRRVVVSNHSGEVPIGTLRAICAQAGWDFRRNAKRRSNMATKYYLAIVDRQPDETSWSIIFPDFPGTTSVAEKFAAVMHQAKDALATVVEDMHLDGETLPLSIEDDALPDYDRSIFHDPRTLLVPVEIAGRALRVNVSLDEGLLARIDEVSKRTGLSRSALLSRGARAVIAAETNS